MLVTMIKIQIVQRVLVAHAKAKFHKFIAAVCLFAKCIMLTFWLRVPMPIEINLKLFLSYQFGREKFIIFIAIPLQCRAAKKKAFTQLFVKFAFGTVQLLIAQTHTQKMAISIVISSSEKFQTFSNHFRIFAEILSDAFDFRISSD